MMQRSAMWIGAAATVAVSGCTVGPDYERPEAPTPVAYKEAAGWKPSEPRDWQSRGPWWSVYGDPVLDDLERQVDVSNQNLKAAEAAFRQASAIIDVARAGLYPTVTTGGSVQRLGSGSQATSSGGRSASGRKETLYDVSVSAAWVPDLWGRIRRTVESDTALAEVSAADLASARLSAQSALAVAYMQLRSDDELKRLLEAAVVAYTASLEITRNRYDAGIAAQSDVVQAEAQRETTRAQA